MSLRARLLAGMVVVSFVLVTAAVIVARTTQANLVDRVDQQLASAGPFTAAVPVGGPTQFYAAEISNGIFSNVVQPNVRDVGLPAVTIGEALRGARPASRSRSPAEPGPDDSACSRSVRPRV